MLEGRQAADVLAMDLSTNPNKKDEQCHTGARVERWAGRLCDVDGEYAGRRRVIESEGEINEPG